MRSILTACLTVALIPWPASPIGAQAPPVATIDAARLRDAASYVERYRGRLGLPGVAFSVATPDSVLLAAGFGHGTFGGNPLTASTPVGIGSVTKTFTAAAVVELAHRGVLDLDAPIESYLPEFRMGGRFTPRSITLRHLLQHRSGFRQWDGHDDRAQRDGRFDHLAPAGPPGGKGEYSSLNYIVLGRILEAVTGQSYAVTLDRILFDPLDLDHAFVADRKPLPLDRARGHQSWFGLQVGRDEPRPPPRLIPAGFIGVSANELGRYGGMLLGGGRFAGTRVLDEAAVAELLGPIDTSGTSLGWGRRRVAGELHLEHKGNARTTSARIRLLPERGYAISLLATTNSGPFFDSADQMLDGIQQIIERGHAPSPWPKERLFKGVVLAGTLWSVASLIRQARRWDTAGHPVGIRNSRESLGRLTLDLAFGGVVLFGIPRLVGVPLPTLFEYFPDLGVAISVSAGAGVIGGILRAFTASASPSS